MTSTRKVTRSRKGQPCPQKGKPTGAKASYTPSQYKTIRASFAGRYAERDRLWFTLDTFLGARVSELNHLRWSDVMHPDGRVRDTVYWDSWHQKGGWGKSPDYIPPPPKDPGHVPGCACYTCQILRGERQPKAYRPPPPREIPLPYELHADLRAWQASQAKTPRGWHYEDFLFQSRKRAKDGGSRPISRQQMWHVLKQTVTRARGLDPTLLGAEKYGTHSMRRTAINAINERTKDMGKAAKFANHRNRATTAVYLEVDPRLLEEAVRGNATDWLAA
jgi:integrase